MIADKKRKILEKNLSDDTLVILEGKTEQIRNGDVHYPFRQDSDFLLLTGLDIPDLCLVGYKEHGEMRWILYSDPISEHEMIWGTSRLSYRELHEKSGIDDIRGKSAYIGDIRALAERSRQIYTRAYASRRGWSHSREKHISLEPLLRELRMTKLPEEIDAIREAIRVTKLAHDHIRTSIEP